MTLMMELTMQELVSDDISTDNEKKQKMKETVFCGK